MENDFKNLINADNASAYANSKEKNCLQERSKGITRESCYKNNQNYLKLTYQLHEQYSFV